MLLARGRHRRSTSRFSRTIVALSAALGLAATGVTVATPAQAQAFCLPDMAYSRYIADNNPRIFFRSNCGNTITQLTTQTYNSADSAPRVSPDGTAVAFVRSQDAHVDGGVAHDIFMVSTTTPGEGSNLTKTPELFKSGADWSPDSRRVVFDAAVRGSNSYIFTVNRDGTSTAQLTSGDDANDNEPCWSLDNRIAFQRFQVDNTGSKSNLFAMGSDGSALRTVTDTPGEKFNCTWSPDSRYIFYGETTNPNTGAQTSAVADVATGKTARLPGVGGASPTVANDWTTASMVVAAAPAYFQIGTYNYATASSTPLSQSGNRELSPSFVRSGPIGSMPAGFPPAELGGGPTTPMPTPTPTPMPSPSGGSTVKAHAAGDGDSFGSGEGSGDYLPGTETSTNHCHRSPHSYQQLVANRLGYDLNFHACSGAVIQDFYGPWSQNHPGSVNAGEKAQLSWINSSQKLVMISIGGNNVHFADVIAGCVIRDYAIYPTCEKDYNKRVQKWILDLQNSGSLEKLYRSVKTKAAPRADILVNEYPRFFPLNPKSTCNADGVKFPPSDQRWFNDNVLWLNQIIVAAAKRAGVTPVDTYDAFDRHELCTSQSWMNGLKLSLNGSVRQESFHPNGLGYAAEARINLRKLGVS